MCPGPLFGGRTGKSREEVGCHSGQSPAIPLHCVDGIRHGLVAGERGERRYCMSNTSVSGSETRTMGVTVTLRGTQAG